MIGIKRPVFLLSERPDKLEQVRSSVSSSVSGGICIRCTLLSWIKNSVSQSKTAQRLQDHVRTVNTGIHFTLILAAKETRRQRKNSPNEAVLWNPEAE